MSYQERIAAERKRTGVSEVRLHHLPNPHRLRLMKRFGTDPPGYSAGWAVLMNAIRNYGGWLDHWGSTVLDGVRVFVSEPYLNPSDIPKAEQFASDAGFRIEFREESWWNPPSTSRIIFWVEQ